MIDLLKKYNYISFTLAFIGLPILLFALGDFPPRTFLKNAISLVTLLAFSLILGQFFLSRTNNLTKNIHKFKNVIALHKAIGYFVVGVFFLHPFLIILPRYFEAGPDPLDSFIKMITTFESLGVILGLIAWSLMLIIGLTALFREKLGISYKGWRVFHGVLSLAFVIIATWHSVDLGRHTNITISLFFIIMATLGSLLLVKLYIVSNKKKELTDVK
ncbi:MAG: ferric reductase-like transmembrane domain-containing protein [Sulfurimonas sp.]|nr:ferric reductase-like transmembrane domain-containing protein [Sulfurimonas sp.]